MSLPSLCHLTILSEPIGGYQFGELDTLIEKTKNEPKRRVPSEEEMTELFASHGETVYDISSKHAWLKICKDDNVNVFVKIFFCIYRLPSPGHNTERVMRLLHKAIDDTSSRSTSLMQNPINSLLFVVDYELIFGYDVDGSIKNCKLDLEEGLLINDDGFKLPLQKNYVSCWVDAPLCWLMNSIPDFEVSKLNYYNTDTCERGNGIEAVNQMFHPFEFKRIEERAEGLLYLVDVGGHYVCVHYNTDKTYDYYDPFSGRALRCKSHIGYFKSKDHYCVARAGQ
jgi:hypothetical protein